MPDSVLLVVVPGLSATARARAAVERAFADQVALGPTFPVLEQPTLGTLLSGQEEPGRRLWLRQNEPGRPPAQDDQPQAEKTLWLWQHLRKHRPGLTTLGWLLPLPWVDTSLGAALPGRDDGPGVAIWPESLRQRVLSQCGLWPPSQAPLEVSPAEGQRHLAEFSRWVFASAAAALRQHEVALAVIYVPVVLAAAYLFGTGSPSFAAVAEQCAQHLLEFARELTGEEVLFLLDPWGLERAAACVELEPLAAQVDQLARTLPAESLPPEHALFTLRVEHQVACLSWSPQVPLDATELAEQLASATPGVEPLEPEQLGLHQPGSHAAAQRQLWFVAPEQAVFLPPAQPGDTSEAASPRLRVCCWELGRWLGRWGLRLPQSGQLSCPQATHGRSAETPRQQGMLWTNTPGVLFAPVLSDLDLAGLVLSHWGV